MKIAGVQRVSLIDFPGRVAATVFLAGCNLNCGYCYNRWMIDAERTPEALDVPAFLAWLETRRKLLDGVCVSGGEPTLQAELATLLRAIKALGLAIKLDTNGTLPERIEALLAEGLVDYVALDLKAPLDERYARVVGRSIDLDAIRRTLAILRAGHIPYEYRTTVGPALDEAALSDLAHVVAPQETWFLQPFLAREGVDAATAQLPAFDEEALRAITARLRALVGGVRLRGDDASS
jgi:pyruvate formate lyase activating enzyme